MQNARCYRRAYVVSCMTCAVHAHSHHYLSGETGGGKKWWRQENANKNAREDASAIFYLFIAFFSAVNAPKRNPHQTPAGPATSTSAPASSSLPVAHTPSFPLSPPSHWLIPLRFHSSCRFPPFQPLYFRRKNVNARAAVPFSEQLLCLLPTNARFRAYYQRTHGREKWNEHLHVLSKQCFVQPDVFFILLLI